MSAQKTNQVEYDLCIIGSGPAGIIVGLEYSLANPHHKVLLVEFGSDQPTGKNSLDNSIRNMNPLNHHNPYETTNKGIGGSTASWGGRCVMFDEVDFIERPVHGGGCTWDLTILQELRQHTERAAGYFECGRPVFNLNEYAQFKGARIAEYFEEGDVTDSVLERWSMPTRFGQRYSKELAELSNLTLMESHEVREFSKPDNEGNVNWISVRKVGSAKWIRIKAKAFVISAGTQETTRLLLRNKQLFSRLKAVPAALGKYYQGHISGKIATVKFYGNPKKTDYGFIRDTDGTYLRRRFQFSKEFLLKQNLLNAAIWLDNPLYFDPKHRSGAMSFMYLAMLIPFLGKRLAPPAIAHSITKGKRNEVRKHFFNVIKDLPASLAKPAAIFYKRYCLKRKLPGVFLYSPQNNYALHFHAEQVPDEKSRMVLGADGETLEIHYSINDIDIQSVILLHEALDSWLRKCGCGELQFWYKKEELAEAIRNMSCDGIHQTGTTRMADTPELGVVDRNLKLWGTSNVYVCSCSVFPTSGQANPTFLLGAFAVRLSRYLTSKVPKIHQDKQYA
ncbi:GMC oxidoreductase [Cesiribacter sp. SM1]|uniref:GMC oxidoreductase n=1 Tax=Cesiribacter sp. SM1 TaxID=2861196 RepID=UPI001CD28300|nr:GMC oxidoreductase [Cesiribacter sp. SM1]